MRKLLIALAALITIAPTAVLAQTPAAEPAPVQSAQTSTVDADNPSKLLPAEIENRFKSIRTDPDPEQLVRNAHYWVSNENAHYVWYPHIKDKGGVLSGVGTDQVYLLAGWSNASIVIPMDFDRMIRALHVAYGAAFMASANIDEFRSFWKKESESKMKEALAKYFPNDAADALKAWKSGRGEVNGRINRVIKKYKGNNMPPTFLTDESQFMRIKTLWENHRVFPICGDLTGNNAMLDIAKALKDSGMKMAFLYPSNAEHYFAYGPAYRRNIIEMPFKDDSLILRTRQMRSLGAAEEGDYHYNMQSGANFQHWLKTTNIKDQISMLKKRTKTSTEGLSVLDYSPEPSKKAPEIAPVP